MLHLSKMYDIAILDQMLDQILDQMFFQTGCIRQRCMISRYLIRCTADLICATDRGRRSRCSTWPMHFVTRKYAQIFTTSISSWIFGITLNLKFEKSLQYNPCMRYKMRKKLFMPFLFNSYENYQ